MIDALRRLAALLRSVVGDLALFVGGVLALEVLSAIPEFCELISVGPGGQGAVLWSSIGLAAVLFAWLGIRMTGRLRRLRVRQEGAWESISERGTVTVEFILVMPVLILLFGTLYQLTIIANAAQVVRYAAFAGARTAIVNGTLDTTMSAGTFFSEYPPMGPFVFDEGPPKQAVYMALAGMSPGVFSPPSHAQSGATSATAEAFGNFASLNAVLHSGLSWTAPYLANAYQYAANSTIVTFNTDKTTIILTPEEYVQPQYTIAGLDTTNYVPTPTSAHIAKMLDFGADPVETGITDVVDGFFNSFQAGTSTSALKLPTNSWAPKASNVKLGIKKAAAKMLAEVVVKEVEKALDDAEQAVAKGLEAAVDKMVKAIVDNLSVSVASLLSPITEALNSAANELATMPDPFAPQKVEVTVQYMLRLPFPSIFYFTSSNPSGYQYPGRAFLLDAPEYFTATLHTTVRRASLLSLITTIPNAGKVVGLVADVAGDDEEEESTIPNTPLYYRGRPEAGYTFGDKLTPSTAPSGSADPTNSPEGYPPGTQPPNTGEDGSPAIPPHPSSDPGKGPHWVVKTGLAGNGLPMTVVGTGTTTELYLDCNTNKLYTWAAGTWDRSKYPPKFVAQTPSWGTGQIIPAAVIQHKSHGWSSAQQWLDTYNGEYYLRVKEETGPNGYKSYQPMKSGHSGGHWKEAAKFSKPTVGFTVNPSSGEGPLGVNCVSTVSGGGLSWAWNFGDGSKSSAHNPTHEYAKVTSKHTYKVTLTVTGPGGAVTEHKYVTVNPPPPKKKQ